MLNIYFDGTQLNPDAIIGVNQSGEGQSTSFKLGTTICREVELLVLKEYVASHPTSVTIYHDSTLYLTLHVDSVEATNNFVYKYTLTDSMIEFDRVIDFSSLATKTAQNVLDFICSGICSSTTITYGGDILVEYSDKYTARDFIGFVAELQGGYAYISPNNTLSFASYTNTSSATITQESVSRTTAGDLVAIYKTILNDGETILEYGSEGPAMYLNPYNVLIKDEGNYTKQAIVDYIGNILNGFSFYNMSIEYIDPVALPYLLIPNSTITIGMYNTLWQIDLTYQGNWLGGLELNVATPEQAATNVISSDTNTAIKNIESNVESQQSTINSHSDAIEELENHNIHFRVRTNDVVVTSQNDSNPTSYTSFQTDGMRIYVENKQVAQATATSFNCDAGLGVQKWEIAGIGNALLFFRKG